MHSFHLRSPWGILNTGSSSNKHLTSNQKGEVYSSTYLNSSSVRGSGNNRDLRLPGREKGYNDKARRTALTGGLAPLPLAPLCQRAADVPPEQALRGLTHQVDPGGIEMRNRMVALVLLVMPPVMSTLAAPVPEPYAILDRGPLPKSERLQALRDSEIDGMTSPYGVLVNGARRDPEIRKLPAVAALKDPREWLAKNLHIAQEHDGDRLRITFRAGTRAEQVAILNAMLRSHMDRKAQTISRLEEILQRYEQSAKSRLEALQKLPGGMVRESFQAEWEAAAAVTNQVRDEIARLRRIAVARWAR
jgi:hypothetical protein